MAVSVGLALLAAAVTAAAVVGADPAARERMRTRAADGSRQLGVRVGDVVPQRWRGGLAARLLAAGVDPTAGLDAAIGLRVASVVAALVVVGLGMAVGVGGSGRIVLVVVAGAVVVSPELALRRRTDRRRRDMSRDLPRLLDLLVISVEAGLGLDQALARVVAAVPGALADEFARLLAEVGAGVPRGDALRGLASRCPVAELRSFALAMVQADAYGVSVGPLLRSQASEIRIRQRQAAQMQAQKAPVKLLVPMVLCIFPALLVVVAGPALLSIRVLLGG